MLSLNAYRHSIALLGDSAQQRERLLAGLEMRAHGAAGHVGIALPQSCDDLRVVRMRALFDPRQFL
jgi:hypothetical protein